MAKRKNSKGFKKGARFQDEFDVKEDNFQMPQQNKKPKRDSNQQAEDGKPKDFVKFNSKSDGKHKQARFLGFSKNKIQKISHNNKKSK